MGESSKEQTTKNLGANIAYFILNILIGIFLIPYYIDTLGIAAYGLIPLATSLTGYIGILTNSLNSAVSRYFTVDLHRSDVEGANRTFNSAFFGVTRTVLITVPIVLIISFLAPTIFRVSPEHSMDTSWLFLGIGLAFLIRAWSSNFTVTLYASNRMDLINIVQLSNITVQISLIVTLFSISSPSLANIGVSYILSAILATIVSIILYMRNDKKLTIKYRYYNAEKFREMAQMGGWVIIDQIGTLLLLNIDLIVVNYLFGSGVGGSYAIAYQWSTLLRGLASTLVSVLGPVILIAYANRQREKILAVTKSAIKMISIGLALPIGLLCGFAPLILGTWVGAEYAYLAPLMILLTSHQVINLAVVPLFYIDTAYNRVRVPAIITIVTGIGNVVLAFILASSFQWGVYGVAAAGLIVLTSKNLIFTPIYASTILGVRKSTFYPSIVPGAIATLGIAIISSTLSLLIPMGDLAPLLLVVCVIVTSYVLFSWKYLLKEGEKSIFPFKARLS